VDTLVPRQENFYDLILQLLSIACKLTKKNKLSDVSFEKKNYLFLDKKNFEPVDIAKLYKYTKEAFLSF